MKAYTYELGGNGKGKETEIPADLKDAGAGGAREAGGAGRRGRRQADGRSSSRRGRFREEDLIPALHNAIREDKIFPVIFSSGLGNIGADRVMDFIVDYTPAPSEHEWVQGERRRPEMASPRSGMRRMRSRFRSMCSKRCRIAFAGRISYFKVFSGVLKNDATVQNFSRGSQEKLAHISIMQGKTAVPVTELHAGDIGAVAKLKDTLTGDTLGDKTAPIQYPRVKLPEPAITFAIEPKSRADEDKLGPGIHKLMEEDAMLRFFRDPQTKEFLIAGTGQQHIEVVVAKLKKRYHTEVILKAPKVPYRETIRGKADVQGTAQEADRRPRPVRRLQDQDGAAAARRRVRVRQRHFRRRDSEELHSRRWKREFRDAAARGYLAGFPGGGFPSDPLRRLVSRRGFERHVVPDGGPHRLQESHGGGEADAARARHGGRRSRCRTNLPASIMGDLNSRRGRIQGMDNKGGNTVVKAEVPMAEMLTYGVDLTSMTQGRGSFNMEMHHYDVVPGQLQEKIIEKAKAERGEVKEEEEYVFAPLMWGGCGSDTLVRRL